MTHGYLSQEMAGSQAHAKREHLSQEEINVEGVM